MRVRFVGMLPVNSHITEAGVVRVAVHSSGDLSKSTKGKENTLSNHINIFANQFDIFHHFLKFKK